MTEKLLTGTLNKSRNHYANMSVQYTAIFNGRNNGNYQMKNVRMRKFIHVHASPYLFEKRSHYDAIVIKPDRNQLVYSKNGYYNFHRSKRWPSGQGLGLRGRGGSP